MRPAIHCGPGVLALVVILTAGGCSSAIESTLPMPATPPALLPSLKLEASNAAPVDSTATTYWALTPALGQSAKISQPSGNRQLDDAMTCLLHTLSGYVLMTSGEERHAPVGPRKIAARPSAGSIASLLKKRASLQGALNKGKAALKAKNLATLTGWLDVFVAVLDATEQPATP